MLDNESTPWYKEGLNMTMTNDKWKPCNDMIGRILTYLDEDNASKGTKKAVKSEIWDFYNEHVNGDEDDDGKEIDGNK